MAVKYIRVVLAYKEENEALLQVALENLIEADTFGGPSAGVEGAYISAPYDHRHDALMTAPWTNRPPMTPEQQTAFDEAAEAYEQTMKEYWK